MTLSGLKCAIKDPKTIFMMLGARGLLDWMSDEQFLKIAYYLKIGKKLDLKNPKTFNEKLQWLKLYDRKPIYTTMVDKYAVKEYVANLIGEEYVIPTYGVWDTFDEINFDALPDQFVLKCTHDCGGLVICRDKSNLDIRAAKAKITKCLKRNYYNTSREWPYKNVKPRIIAEKYTQDGDTQTLPVYKVFTFGGEPKLIQAIQNDKTPEETIDYFDPEWNRLDLRQNFPNSKSPLKKPAQLQQILQLSRNICVALPFVRTDFYIINGEVYFSEFTFYSDSGLAVFHPQWWDETLGNWLKLPEINNH